jgi:hypothetical protein
MLPALDRLAVGARTGVNPAVKKRHKEAEETRSQVLHEADLVTAVLEAIKVDDWQTACNTAKSWCATDWLRQDTCSKAHGSWKVLNERYFHGSPLNGRWANPIIDFYENCRRATEYQDGDQDLEDDDAGCATFVLEALSLVGTADRWQIVHAELKNDPAFVLKAAAVQGNILQHVSDHYKRNKAVVLAAVKNRGMAIRYADTRFRQDPDIAFAAVTQDGAAMQYLDSSYRASSKYMLVAVQNCPVALQWGMGTTTRNKKVVLAAVHSYGAQLRFADRQVQGDRQIVLAAIENFPNALQYALFELRDDREIVITAVRKNGAALQHASMGMRNDRAVVMAAVREYPRSLEYASMALRNDYHVVMQAVTAKIVNGDTALRWASDNLKMNVDIVREAVRNDARAWDYSLKPAKTDASVLHIRDALWGH